jgi:hypothetical protein
MRVVWLVQLLVTATLIGGEGREVAEEASSAGPTDLTERSPELNSRQPPQEVSLSVADVCDASPNGAWRLGDFEILDRVVSITQEEAEWYAGKTVSIGQDRIEVGGKSCAINESESQVDVGQWTFETTTRVHHIYMCEDRTIYTFGFGPDCSDPRFEFKEATYPATRVVD